jgi:hypothetical protein
LLDESKTVATSRVTFGVAVMPLAMMVPPLPSEMSWRISRVAPTIFGARQD